MSADFHAGRAVAGACRAPLVAMDFDPLGNVQACCANALFPLGNVNEQTLREIWEGARANLLRDALAAGDLGLGCGVCRHRLDGTGGGVPLDYYEQFPVHDEVPAWPQLLAFSLHNTCNLACVMCGADASSRIRTQRDGLAPLPHSYGDPFFEQLGPFLEHCSHLDFVGGEPFLVREHIRVWELLASIRRDVPVSVTTNATVWNARVEWVLDTFATNVCVSIDAVDPDVFEAQRVGAVHAEVFDNLHRFHAYTRTRGTALTLSFSLTRHNWHELGAVLGLAEQLEAGINVQTVMEPDHGLQRAPTAELAAAVDDLRRQGESLRPTLTTTGSTWDREIRRLEVELDRRRERRPRNRIMEPPAPDHRDHAVAFARATSTPRSQRAAALARAIAGLRRWSPDGSVARFDLDRSGAITSITTDGGDPFASIGVRCDALPGHPLSELIAMVEAELGAQLWIAEEAAEPDRREQTLWFGRDVRDKAGLIVRWTTIATGRGRHTIVCATDDRFVPRPSTGETRVRLTERRRRATATAPSEEART